MSVRAGIRRASLVATCVLAASVLGCATTGYRTITTSGHEKVYRYGEHGEKVLVYEVSAGGELTVHDESDPRAQELLAARAAEEHARLMKLSREERLRLAEKRATDDPIRVILFELDLSRDLSREESTKGALARQLDREMGRDGVIAVLDPAVAKRHKLDIGMQQLTGKRKAKAAPACDVEVESHAFLKEKIGINEHTGKFGKYEIVVFEAKITSNYLPATFRVSEEGELSNRDEVTKRFADQVKSIIKERIGPDIPADRGL